MLRLHSAISIFSAAMLILGMGEVTGQAASTGSGQAYPNKPIRFLTTSVGGGADVVARLIADELAGSIGQPVIVENRLSSTAAEIFSHATPDGYTLLVEGQSLWVATLLQKKPYDVVKDFSPITVVNEFPFLLVVNSSMPVKSVKELIALAKARPGELNYGSGGIGGGIHLAPELFKAMAGVNIVRVPYKGVGGALNALLGGEVQLMFGSQSSMSANLKSGKLRALAITSLQPSALAPGLPTMAASGLPGFEVVSSTAMFALKGTPSTTINRLYQETVRTLGRPDVKEKTLRTGAEVVGNTPEQATAKIKSEMAKWSKLFKDAGIRAEE